MFGRGNWAIIGLKSESRDNFYSSLNTLATTLAVSQLAAAAVTRHRDRDTVGINPFSAPRLDDESPLSDEGELSMVAYMEADRDDKALYDINGIIGDSEGFGTGPDTFTIDQDGNQFGFWFVLNNYKDVSHSASIKEHYAYENFLRPVKFLNPTDKKVVDAETQPTTKAIRKQFPVLVDFVKGRVFIESTNKAEILAVQEILSTLGAEIHTLVWSFDVTGHWPSTVLSKLYGETQHTEAFVKRAEEAARFSPSEIEKLEDLELQGLVTKHFSTTDLGGDEWASLSAPALITLAPNTPPIGVQSSTNATTVLNLKEETGVYAASVTVQERISFPDKKTGETRTFRKDLFTFDLNDGINVVEVGAACLKGFDLPGFKKSLMKEMRQTKQIPPLNRFWHDWLVGMTAATHQIAFHIKGLLEITDEGSGLVPMVATGTDEVIEVGE